MAGFAIKVFPELKTRSSGVQLEKGPALLAAPLSMPIGLAP
jgi:hypothetical protein